MKKKKITVLGAGMVGRTLAIDMAQQHQVTSVDVSANNLALIPSSAKVKTVLGDLSNALEIRRVIKDADLVMGAVPSFMGYKMLQTVVEQKKDIVDISFFPEDPYGLDELARKNKVTAIVDCGVAPGMDNIILGYHYQQMKVNRFVCMVGGLPAVRQLPWQYKAPFSPIDVLEEYTRPARLVQNGKMITLPALTEPELVEFAGVGTLEAFNTDGLRTLLKMDVPDMVEKTLRYPGHLALMKVLRDAGFFSKDKITVKGEKVTPIEVAAAILFPQWKYEKGEADFTVMRVIVEGDEKKSKKRYTYDLLDRYHGSTSTMSMARTTGYTATAAANLILGGHYKKQGIIAPEMLGAEKKCFDFMLAYLKKRGVEYRVVTETL